MRLSAVTLMVVVLSAAGLASGLSVTDALAQDPTPASSWVSLMPGADEDMPSVSSTGLPAMSSDGSQIATFLQQSSVADVVTYTFSVIDDEDYFNSVTLSLELHVESTGTYRTVMVGFVDAINATMAHGEWRPLTLLNRTAQGPDYAPDFVRLGMVDRDLEIIHQRGGQRIVAHSVSSGLSVVRHVHNASIEAVEEDDLTCLNQAFIAAGWADPSLSVVVLRMSYDGNDTCLEPPDFVVDLHLETADMSTCQGNGGECMEGCTAGHRSIGAFACFDSTCCVPDSLPQSCSTAGGSCIPAATCAGTPIPSGACFAESMVCCR